MAIMGFGGGALIGAPLGVKLMDHFKSETSVGVAEAFVVMAVLYAISMLFGACLIRVPPEGWTWMQFRWAGACFSRCRSACHFLAGHSNPQQKRARHRKLSSVDDFFQIWGIAAKTFRWT